MKTRIAILVSLFLFMGMNVHLMAQRAQRTNQNRICLTIPDLTPEQQSEIEALRTGQLARATAHRAQMAEHRARHQSLSMAQSPDMEQINSNIDQMANIRSEHMKSNAEHKQQIRRLLTDEQRVYFDSRSNTGPRGRGNFGHDRRGRGNGRMHRLR